MKVHVDQEKCQGHALCALKAPGIFTLDRDSDRSTALDGEVPAGAEAAVLDAVDSCPEQAITQFSASVGWGAD
jgi:ferredoxin